MTDDVAVSVAGLPLKPLDRLQPYSPGITVERPEPVGDYRVPDGRLLAGLEPVFGGLSWNEIVLRDSKLLFLDVSREIKNFHSVPQRSRNWIEHVCSRDKQHLA